MSNSVFPLGKIVATPGALAELARAGEDLLHYLARHVRGDWGDLTDDDKKENDSSVTKGCRILSAHTLSTGTKIWNITEAEEVRPVFFYLAIIKNGPLWIFGNIINIHYLH